MPLGVVSHGRLAGRNIKGCSRSTMHSSVQPSGCSNRRNQQTSDEKQLPDHA